MSSIVFDESFMHKLEQLSLVARRIRTSHYRGEKRSRRRGQSIEFADYRNYVQGDDLRALDWNIFARLERPFIKLFEEEIDQTVHILLDASASMNWPLEEKAHSKWVYARRLAAALGYVALANHDRLFVAGLKAAEIKTWGPERQRQRVHSLLNFLSDFSAEGETHLSASLSRYARQKKRPGLVFFISDFLSSEDYQAGLNALQYYGHEVAILHLLSPDEIEPALAGDFQLLDIETEARQDITINATMKKLYQEHFMAWQGALSQFCRQRDIHYALLNTDQPFEALILKHLRQRGFVK